jgi:hypothetical protein
LNKDITKQLTDFERKVLRRMFGGELNKDWRMRYNKELMQLFGGLDILSFVRVSRLNWIGHVNRMDSNIKVSLVFHNNPLGKSTKRMTKKQMMGLCTHRY